MATGTEKSAIVKSVNVRNAGEKEITLCVEPWADEYTLKPDQMLQVVFEATEPGEPEVLHMPDRVLVYGWPTSMFQVLEDGVDLREEREA